MKKLSILTILKVEVISFPTGHQRTKQVFEYGLNLPEWKQFDL